MDQDMYEKMVKGLAEFPESANSISVKVQNGRLILKGTALTAKERSSIQHLATSLAGKDNVENHIAVIGGAHKGTFGYILGIDQ